MFRRADGFLGRLGSTPLGVAAVAIPAIVYLIIVRSGYDGEPFLRGDGGYYLRAAQSLLRDGDLDLTNQLPGGPRRHYDQVAWSIDGRPVPKHPLVLPVVSAPFVAAFGPRGALIFNVTQLIALAGVLFGLARLVAAPAPAALASVLTSVATMLPHYAWNYSPDVLATLLLASAVLALRHARPAARGHYVASGLLAGLAVIGKYPLVLCVPGLLLLFRPIAWRSLAWFGAGILMPLLSLFALNAHLFGSPFTTAYNHILQYGLDGVPGTYSATGMFLVPIVTGMRAQLADPVHGLIATSVLTVLSWLGLPALARRDPMLAIYASIIAVALFLLYSTYIDWNTSHYGNRFLLPVVAFAVLPLASLLDGMAARLGRRAGAATRSRGGGESSNPGATGPD